MKSGGTFAITPIWGQPVQSNLQVLRGPYYASTAFNGIMHYRETPPCLYIKRLHMSEMSIPLLGEELQG